MKRSYTAEHVWLLADGAIGTVGITLHAQDALGDVVFVDLPQIGQRFDGGQAAGVVESVKTASDVHMPVDGEITEVNEALRADPGLANTDPLGEGWFFKIRLDNPEQADTLMDEAAYTDFTGG